MVDLFNPDRVIYVCSCGADKPISRIYFCRHCLKLRCGNCVTHEVDSHYCPNCLESMPSAEARVKKNRCGSCFDCPSCKHTLSTRASSIQVPSAEDNSKTIPKKVYYLACGFCRWTSRDAGLKDQNVASGGWQEIENPDSKTVASLIEHYRALALHDKMEKEHRKTMRKRPFIQFSDKYTLSALMSKKKTSLPSIGGLNLRSDDSKALEMQPGVAVEEMEELSDDYFTRAVTLPLKCTVSQMLMQPEVQTANTTDLYPRHKHLLVKRSQRCRECEHNLSKPEFNPSSIKFKIQLAAYYHVPNIRLSAEIQLAVNEKTRAVLTLTNPTQNTMHVTLQPGNLTEYKQSGKVELPQAEIIIGPRDDAAEFDDMSENMGFEDDPKIISFRKANKVGVFVDITPLKKHVDIRLPILIRYDYLNTMPQAQADPREPQITWLEHQLIVNFGHA
uniref:Dynactin subunit 4 n=1 Tax=Strigamia maritima TaxID=126957 RepID=T1JF52_STRMM